MNRAGVLPGLEALPDRARLAEAAAAILAAEIAAALRGPGRASFAATGGSTPAPAYRELANAPLDWSRVDVTLTDERWVDPDSDESNARMVRESLLAGRAAAARLTPLWSAAPSPKKAAEAAEAAVSVLLPFSAVLLGMGEDGHVASLFPGSPALAAGLDPSGARLCLGVPAARPAPVQPRISLTLGALLQTRLLLLLVAGPDKRRTLESALAGADMPVRAVLQQDRAPVRILWSP